MTETAFNKVMSGLKEARAYAEGARIGFHVNDRVSADKQKRTSDVLLMEKMRDSVFSYLGGQQINSIIVSFKPQLAITSMHSAQR